MRKLTIEQEMQLEELKGIVQAHKDLWNNLEDIKKNFSTVSGETKHIHIFDNGYASAEELFKKLGSKPISRGNDIYPVEYRLMIDDVELLFIPFQDS